jgi:ABC-2 type transport system ATP-binding protein
MGGIDMVSMGEIGMGEITVDSAVSLRGLQKTYGDFKLQDVTFEVPKGFITGFIGPNGAGKTTTIKLILGAAKLEAGEITLLGAKSGNSSANSIGMNTEIGVVMDLPPYSDDWKIKDVESVLSPFYENWDSERFSKLIKSFGLDFKKKVKDLSRGMKVKIQIAAALSHKAQLLILDEPTSGLDPVARDEICDLLRDFVEDEEHSVLYSTHITADLEKTADFITFIQKGKIIYTGSKDGLTEKYLRVTGGLCDIGSDERGFIIGYRAHKTGFEGMIEAANAPKLSRNVIREPINIDGIMVYMNKGEKFHEQDE